MDIIVKMVTSAQFISSIVIILFTIIATLVIEHMHKLYVKKDQQYGTDERDSQIDV